MKIQRNRIQEDKKAKKTSKLEAVCCFTHQYPDSEVPEIALVGRSNCGKSSLINYLVNRKSLARIGGTPGKTRTVNFYNIDEKLFLVDLPGYGYAKIAKSSQQSWKEVIEPYLNNRNQLKLMLLLLDIRHLPSEDDRVMFEWILRSQKEFLIIATKSDKLNKVEVRNNIKLIAENLGLDSYDKIVPVSSFKKLGKEMVWERILSICNIQD